MENVPFPNLIRPEVAAMAKERVDEFVKVQKELLEKLQEMNRANASLPIFRSSWRPVRASWRTVVGPAGLTQEVR
jgi:hypothetical protein